MPSQNSSIIFNEEKKDDDKMNAKILEQNKKSVLELKKDFEYVIVQMEKIDTKTSTVIEQDKIAQKVSTLIPNFSPIKPRIANLQGN